MICVNLLLNQVLDWFAQRVPDILHVYSEEHFTQEEEEMGYKTRGDRDSTGAKSQESKD